ncbi:MAG: decarboxylating 6-phosphogluconate dehydrogenase [Candidatus Babeliales bacterium]|jgi:6-phosphogluconate dehydrogenase
MNIGIIGLGRMGNAIAYRLIKAGHTVTGFDPSIEAQTAAQEIGVTCKKIISECVAHADIIWLMVPAGKPVDDAFAGIQEAIKKHAIVIDGGNSFYKDTIARAKNLARHNISFLDCGTSGGLYGKEHGFSLMIGGEKDAYEKALPIFQAIAAPNGYAHVGPSGAGHFVKMVHNGIEYGLMQAYAEGFHVLKQGPLQDLDLEQIATVWNHGAIIRSWLLELTREIFSRGSTLENISGEIGENKTGQWTVVTAKESAIPVDVIATALKVRAWSRESGGNYATKLVAMMRHEFGGHEIKKV